MIRKFLFILLMISSTLIAQESRVVENKEPAKEGGKEVVKDPVKISDKEIIREMQETKKYYDPEEKKNIKILTSYYLKDKIEVSHGPSKNFYLNGQVAHEMNFADGFKNGEETFFTDKGLKEHQLVWKNGELVKDIVFFIDGAINKEVELKTIEVKSLEPGKPSSRKQIKNGIENIYFKNGKVQVKMHWTDDEQNGLETKYFENGQKRYELTWKMNKKDGIETHWFKNGKISNITNWIDNKAHGEMVTYHENGVKKDLLEWDNGVLVNDRSAWNDKGVLIAKCTNKNGNIFKGTLFDVDRLLILTFEEGRQVSSKVCDKEGNLKEK